MLLIIFLQMCVSQMRMPHKNLRLSCNGRFWKFYHNHVCLYVDNTLLDSNLTSTWIPEVMEAGN